MKTNNQPKWFCQGCGQEICDCGVIIWSKKIKIWEI